MNLFKFYLEDMKKNPNATLEEGAKKSKKRGRPMKGPERLESRLGFRIPQSLHNEVLRVCNERNITKSEFILESITSNLEAK